MRLLVDSVSETTKGYDVQAKTIGEALNFLRKKDASHIHFGKLTGGEQAVDLAKYLLVLAKDGLMNKMTFSHDGLSMLHALDLVDVLSTVDFYTGATNINGVKY